jgi:arylsulfatase A-like enzyme
MKNKRQNILFIITDQQRYDSLGCCGNKYAITPNIDSLAEQGTIFDRCITTSAICSPSRASIISGLHSSTHGLWTNGCALPNESYVAISEGSRRAFPGKWVASHITTFPELFNSAGYTTEAIGKLHLTPVSAHHSTGYQESGNVWRHNPSMKDWHGPYYGFDHVELTIGHGEHIGGHYGTWLQEEHPEIAQARKESALKRKLEFPYEPKLYPSAIPPELHNTTWITDQVCKRIQSAARLDMPFLMWVGYPDPHSPFVPPKELADEFSAHDVHMPLVPSGEWSDKPFALRHLMEKRNAGTYSEELLKRIRQYTDAMVHHIDTGIGRIIKTLKQYNFWENTIIIFTSDHGDFLGDYGMHGKCVPCCMPLNHVPLVMRVPDTNWPKRIQSTISGVDFLPTLCDLANIETPQLVHGEPISSIIRNGRSNNAMVQHYTPTPERQNISVFDDQFRLTWYTSTNETEMYDHKADPHELRNIANDARYGSQRDYLISQLKELQCRTLTPRAGRVAVW